MDKVALITGGARGIGLGISRKLASEGWNLSLCGIKEESAVPALGELSGYGVKVQYTQADIGVGEDRIRLIKRTKDFFNRLDLLVNNAGVAPLERIDLLKADSASYDRVMGINLKGPHFLTRDAAGWMIEEKKTQTDFNGKIIFIGSVSSTLASVNRGEYCISKAGISMAAQLWAARLGEYDIPVYEIRPGIIMTDMTSGVRDKYDKLIEAGILVQPRWGNPEDIGKAVSMLARGDLAYSTGQVITIDGGLTLGRL